MPKTLTSRLVVTTVALVALVTVLVALVTTVAMSQYLTSRLDAQVSQAQDRADRLDHGPLPGGPAGPARSQNLDTLIVDLDTPPQGGILIDDGARGTRTESIDTNAVRQLRTVPADGEPHTVSLGHLGDYRVVVHTDSDSDSVAVGLPMDEIASSTACCSGPRCSRWPGCSSPA